DIIAVLRRPVIASKVDHGTGMRMAAALACRPEITGMWPAVADPMHVVGHRFDIVKCIFGMRAGLARVPAALENMVQMRNHAGGDECMTVIIEINTPGVAGAFGKQFELFGYRMH